MTDSRETRRVVIAIALFVWLVWAFGMATGDRWHLLASGWFMSLTMALGSFVAGSTCEGGGAVAFPVMTLIFEIPPATARDFSLMIQSVGMTAAGLTIWRTGIPVAWRAMGPAILGGSLGMVLGLTLIADRVPPAVAKLVFTSTWLAFGWALWLMSKKRADEPRAALPSVPWIGVIVYSFVGGLISSIVGSGVDICCFALLVLRYDLDEKVATPTSVFLMGIIAAVGFAWQSIAGPGMASASWDWWWACVPVVVVGAPLGAWFIRTRSRAFLVRLIVGSIVVQYLGALYVLPMTMSHWLVSVGVIVLAMLLFSTMSALGRNQSPY